MPAPSPALPPLRYARCARATVERVGRADGFRRRPAYRQMIPQLLSAASSGTAFRNDRPNATLNGVILRRVFAPKDPYLTCEFTGRVGVPRFTRDMNQNHIINSSVR